MAILGNIVKQAIKLGDKLIDLEKGHQAQQATLRHLLNYARFTAIGRAYDFEDILKSDDLEAAFREALPYFSYEEINQKYWQPLREGKINQSWLGSPDYFALSSGTTGKESKRIPVTQEMLDSIQRAGRLQILALNELDLPADFFEKEILMLSSSVDLKKHKGFLEGEISGISASTIPFWFRSYYRPGEEIASINDWDKRVERIAKEAPKWDIGAISGIPSWVELMLEKIIQHHKVDHIHQVWPNLEVYTSGGVAFSPYEKSFRQKLGRPIHVLDTYLASEGYLATQLDPKSEGMRLLLDNGVYYEFVPHKAEHIDESGKVKPSARALNISEVEEDEEYVLIISTNAGAWRYMIGDTVKIIDKEKAEIQITGRTKFFLNKVGSQLSVQKIDAAIKALESAEDLSIKEYTVSAQRNEEGEFEHYWYLGLDERTAVSAEKMASRLDEYLQEANKNYKVARNKALKGLRVTALDADTFYDWNDHQKKKGGQVKMEKVMGDEQFAKWQDFLEQQS